ncbi:hypothetical protein J7I81_08635 [Bacillus sp. ISL-32]|nr:hypothetical protein [Bacillus sp. ISL-32]
MRLTLNRITLENVDDAAGRWQIEGGQMLRGNRPVGNYASTKRIVNQGTSPQNTAMLTLTLFFIDPSDNITLQGSHDFNSGDQIGSVSAATSSFSYYIGHQFRVSGNSLVIQ